MQIRLVESGRKFSQANKDELTEFLLKLPSSHLDSIKTIERIKTLGGALADSSSFGDGGEIRLPNFFYELSKTEREFVFLHEMGHNYFDFRDENEGDMHQILKTTPCERENVSHLLRIQWMELGLWELNAENFEKVKALDPENRANRDKYTYAVMYKDPNYKMGEWTCSEEAKIPQDSFKLGFNYNDFYSPKEEMADAYALFVLERDYFLEFVEKSKLIKAKFDFIQKCFIDNTQI
ncbi:MAG: hypothetical protein NTU63_03830 [Candidatus Pacearchaeota archaeon]|nr:hypothetical protein [Candidatus Pacearchaeota archaeon]